jgi:hypothetical protein
MTSTLFIAIVIALVLIPPYMYWYFARTKSMLATWAAANGFTVLESSRTPFPPLRLLLTTSKQQTLMRIKIYDLSTHRIRSGWLRLGTYWWGLLNDDAIEVNWDDA